MKKLNTMEANLKKVIDSTKNSQSDKSKIYVQMSHCSISVGAFLLYQELRQKLSPDIEVVASGCDGSCFAAPRAVFKSNGTYDVPDDYIKITENFASQNQSMSDLRAFFSHQTRIVMDDIGTMEVDDIGDYLLSDGFMGLGNAFQVSPDDVVGIVEKSGLRGRGGAYFPVSSKWSAAKSFPQEKVLVVNAEEGEPGVFKDRHLMEGAPFRVLEGALIAAYAVSADQVFIYVNAEADLSYKRLEGAISICKQNGLIGNNILETGISINIHVLRGAGGYVCGEESTLINTMEGRRREPRLKPPFPTESGYLGQPTVVNNVETLSNLPYIFKNGAESFSKTGDPNYPGTKIISLSGNVKHPGAIEVPMGTTLDYIVNVVGKGPKINGISGVVVGGPSSGILPVNKLDTTISPGLIDGYSVMVGAGGVIVLGEETDILQEVYRLSEYNASESCGKCTPCREGTPRIREMVQNLSFQPNDQHQWNRLEELAQTVNAASLCGLGQAAGNPVLSFIKHFRKKQRI